jgi:hypothetical protein
MSSPQNMTMILSPNIPRPYGVGGIWMRDLCLTFERDQLCYFCVFPSHVKDWEVPTELEWMPYQQVIEPSLSHSQSQRFGGLIREASSIITLQRYLWFSQSKYIAQCVEFGRRHKVKRVLASLASPQIILLAAKVARALEAELFIQVWDDPSYLLATRQLGHAISHRVMQSFGEALQLSTKTVVMSQNMADAYRRDYNIGSIIMKHGLPLAKHHAPTTKLPDHDKFVIGYAGKPNFTTEFTAFLRALASINWQIDGRQVELHFSGSDLMLTKIDFSTQVHYYGWQTDESLLEMLYKSDLLYLPLHMSTTEYLSLFSHLSFPTKLATYVTAGKPIFYHGPRDGSPMHFFKRYPMAFTCHSFEADDILEILYEVVQGEDRYKQAAEAASQAATQELNAEHFATQWQNVVFAEHRDVNP